MNKLQKAANSIINSYNECQRLLPLAGGIPQPIEKSTDNAVMLAVDYLKNIDNTPITKEYLKLNDFLPDGDNENPTSFGKKIWNKDEHTDYYGKNPGMQILFSFEDNSTFLETYSSEGQTLCLLELDIKPTCGAMNRLIVSLGQK